MVVIMIGRNRITQAWKIASLGDLPPSLGLEGEVDHHDRIFLDDADQENNSDHSHDIQLNAESNKANKTPTPAEGMVERIVIGWMRLS